MEIRLLHLAAFGPFTDRTLDFDQGEGGLHLVYGPNEAGKSSALRGLRALLFGIPERTGDNFVHGNEQLRLGGRLRDQGGHELIFVRRKGHKKTLLSADGEPLDEAALTRFLPGVTAEIFATLFGIDHSALVRGGQEILEQRGEVGQALFAAALGAPALHELLDGLDQDAEGLFLPRGKTQAINAALSRYRDLSKEIRATSLASREWEDHRRELERVSAGLRQIQDELDRTRAEVNRLRRIQRVLPKLARHRELRRLMDEAGEVLILADDFSARRGRAVKELGEARAITRTLGLRLSGLHQQLSGLDVRPVILGQAETVVALHERLGSHRKAMQDRPHLEAERKQLLADARALLMDVRPGLPMDEVESLRVVLAKRGRITALGNQYQALAQRVQRSAEDQRRIQRRLDEARQSMDRLAHTGSPDALRRALVAARRSGDLDGTLAALQNEVRTLASECAQDMARLPLWQGGLAELAGLAVPVGASIEYFEEAYTALAQGRQRLRERREEVQEALRASEQQLEEMRQSGAVPTERELIEARSQRDAAWEGLRRQWLELGAGSGEPRGADTGVRLAEVFEKRMAKADEVADRLRRDGNRVHRQASLLAGRDELKRQTEGLDEELEERAGQQQRLERQWQELWAPCGVQPRTPREMRAWLERLERLREKNARLDGLRQRLEETSRIRDAHFQALGGELQKLGRDVQAPTSSLETLLGAGEEALAGIVDAQNQRQALSREIRTLDGDLKTAHQEGQAAEAGLQEWKRQWHGVVQGLGLGPDTLPAEAAGVMEKLQELFSRLNEAEQRRLRLRGIDGDAEGFAFEVARLVEQVAPELASLPVEQAVVRLNTLLGENRANESRRRQIEAQIREARQEIGEAEATIATMQERLQVLCREAQCAAPEDLEMRERESEEHRRLKMELDRVEREILEAGEGAALTALEAQAQGVDADALPGQIEALARRIREQLEPARSELDQTKGREEKELELMDGSDRAARLAEQAQIVLAGIRTDAERYVRLRLAAHILRREIERYRRENQGPLVQRASDYFSTLTRGSFASLRADFTEKDEPVLVGLRASGQTVCVAGMSSGTRDQLYLALRLASLEKYMESSEPMPFIVDDILVHFDDPRSKATLQVLAELARRTQVILFTHHAHLVEQARALEAEGGVRIFVHHL